MDRHHASTIVPLGLALPALILFLCVGTASAQQYTDDRDDRDDQTDRMTQQLPDAANRYAESRERARQVRLQRDEAVRRFDGARARAWREALSSAEYERAREEVAEARERYEAARQRITDRLAGDEDYRAARDAAEALNARIAAEHDDAESEAFDTDRDRVIDLARQQLRWADRRDALIAHALRSDEQFAALADTLDQKLAQMRSMRTWAYEQIDIDPQVRTARARVDDTLTDLSDADAALAAARSLYVVTRNIAEREYYDRYERDRYDYRHAYLNDPYRWLYGQRYIFRHHRRRHIGSPGLHGGLGH